MLRFLILLLIGCSVVCNADMMVKTRTVMTDTGSNPDIQNPSLHRDIDYRRGPMRRRDSFGNGTTVSFANIANCETKSGFLVDMNAHEYRTFKVVEFAPITRLNDYLKKNPQRTIQVESQTIDTAERKTFFGHPAKHLVTTIKRTRDDNSGGGEETVDGWYIDHESPDNNCAPDYVQNDIYYLVGTVLVSYPDIARFHHTGPLPSGLAVKLRRSVKLGGTKDGAPGRTVTTERDVEDLSDSPLNPSLFELPSGFHENSQLLRSHRSSIQ